MNLRRSLLILSLVTGLSGAQAALIDKVPAGDKAALAAGQTVATSQTVAGYAWPKLVLFRVINAQPDVVAELFGDYAAAPSYIPGMLAVKVLAVNDDGSKDVQYTVKAPVIQSTTYSVRNTYTQKGSTYKVAWTLLKSSLVKTSTGSMKIEPYGQGQSLMRYENLCVPITTWFSAMKTEALKEAKSTVNAIAMESQRRAAGGQ